MYLAAPFWSDVDITNGGAISYEVHTSSTGSQLLESVSPFISEEENVTFDAEWMLVAYWEEVTEFAGPTNIVRTATLILEHRFGWF